MKNNILYFVTDNTNKYKELKELCSNYEIDLIQKKNNNIFYEIQNKSIEKIAYNCSIQGFKNIKEELIVDDSGLFIDSLNGFPGPYSSYIQSTIGNKGILKLMEHIENRTAYLRTSIAYCDSSLNPIVFNGSVKGEISLEEIGTYGFGYDSIFIYKNKTFGLMKYNEKNLYSSRSRAFKLFIDWYTNKLNKE